MKKRTTLTSLFYGIRSNYSKQLIKKDYEKWRQKPDEKYKRRQKKRTSNWFIRYNCHMKRKLKHILLRTIYYDAIISLKFFLIICWTTSRSRRVLWKGIKCSIFSEKGLTCRYRYLWQNHMVLKKTKIYLPHYSIPAIISEGCIH